jgi:opacity protein-like surface antigen
MKKSLLVAALIAAACSTAFAAEVKQDKAQVPVVKAQTMTDAHMDKVTAGAGYGLTTALSGPGSPQGSPGTNGNSPNVNPGYGNCTTGAAGKC